MSRVFNVQFPYGGKSYTALVSIAGREDHTGVRIIPQHDTIEIILPHGTLVFSTADIIQRLLSAPVDHREHATMYITENISMQLMNTTW
ncbi:MAG TPA: hypothetical protein VFZ78_07215 [Flavisolibacter sp.]